MNPCPQAPPTVPLCKKLEGARGGSEYTVSIKLCMYVFTGVIGYEKLLLLRSKWRTLASLGRHSLGSSVRPRYARLSTDSSSKLDFLDMPGSYVPTLQRSYLPQYQSLSFVHVSASLKQLTRSSVRHMIYKGLSQICNSTRPALLSAICFFFSDCLSRKDQHSSWVGLST